MIISGGRWGLVASSAVIENSIFLLPSERPEGTQTSMMNVNASSRHVKGFTFYEQSLCYKQPTNTVGRQLPGSVGESKWSL